MELRHYALPPWEYSPTWTYDQFDPRPYGKPHGLWVSVKGEFDWPSWCESSGFRLSRGPGTEHEVTLMPDANVLHITTQDELKEFTLAYGIAQPEYPGLDTGYAIDWPRVSEQYDGIIISPYMYHWGDEWMMWYYGWDCASGCIWNLSAVATVRVLTEVES